MADVVINSFTKKYGANIVIDKLNLQIHNGEFITLLGPSGCGKTTLLRMIAGLESIEDGELLIGGKSYNNIPAQKRHLAMVFQSYALFPHMSVRNNILFGLKINKVNNAKMQYKLNWVVNLLYLKGLEDRLPREISGGQRQRVALARALVLDPDVLLLDEPLSNLDAALRETAIEELKRIHHQVGKTIIYVTHNQVEALTMSERIALINKGKVEQYDRPKVMYDNPRTLFVAEFIGSPPMNFFEGEVQIMDGSAGVITSIGFLKLDRDRTSRLETMIGRKVIAGIRPQNIYFSEHIIRRRHTDTSLDITVEFVENMGDRSLVIGRTRNSIVVRFMISRDDDVASDKKVAVFLDGRCIHLFDTMSRLNIFNLDGSI
jgi:ABC-type sugar transport system ATPase subunit